MRKGDMIVHLYHQRSSRHRGKASLAFSSLQQPPSARPLRFASHHPPLLQALATTHRPRAPWAKPRRPLSHCPPLGCVEALSRSPPSFVEATFPTSTTDVLHHHRSNLCSSSLPLHEPQAGALHLFSGLPSPVPHNRPASSPRARHGEPLRCLCPKSGPSPTIRPTSRASMGNGGGGTPLFCPGPKGPSGPDRFHSAWPSATKIVAHCNSDIFLLSFKLFKSISKYVSNFRNS
jgi:hypothetical protein